MDVLLTRMARCQYMLQDSPWSLEVCHCRVVGQAFPGPTMAIRGWGARGGPADRCEDRRGDQYCSTLPRITFMIYSESVAAALASHPDSSEVLERPRACSLVLLSSFSPPDASLLGRHLSLRSVTTISLHLVWLHSNLPGRYPLRGIRSLSSRFTIL